MGLSFKLYKKLNYFDLDVECEMGNELLVIEGPSGAGKTTILNCLAGIFSPDEGNISVHSDTFFDSSNRVNIPAERRNIGYLFQSYALFPHMTVRRNIFYGLKNKKEFHNKSKKKHMSAHAESIMANLGIDHLTDKYPSEISGGEKQRVALARAMVTNPVLLLLDEPFSALDTGTKEKIYAEFKEYIKELKIPTILITHDHREAEIFADKRIQIKEGRFM